MYTALDKAVLFHEQQCTFSACVGHDARAELAALRQRVAELEAAQSTEPTIVTPNNCRHCQRAAEKMRDAAVVASVEFAMYAERKDLSGGYSCREVAEQIRSMPLPECDGCNTLAHVVCNDVLHKCAVCGNDADGPFYCADCK